MFPRPRRRDISLASISRTLRRVTPAQLFVGSFLIMSMLGAVGLKTLPGLYTGEPLSWIDAVFTATSAVCVTGLIVVDTATYFTFWGQCFIMLLIQVGGLGMFTFTSLIILALGRRLSLRQQALSMEPASVASHVEPTHLLRDVVLFTFGIEAVGALVLYALWVPELGWAGAAWPAVFHSVSAFCNAGFSTFSDSLIGAEDDLGILAVVMALIVLGGIGFLTLEELYLFWRARRRAQRFRVSLHSRLVLVTTGVLLLVGWLAFLVLEGERTLSHLAPLDRIVNALFMSVTARTAGFNTVDYADVSVGGNYVTILLMSIGGSPGSTAGGLKTTTFALIAIVAWSRIRGEETPSVAGRSVPPETVQRAVGLFVVVFGFVTAGILVLATMETQGEGSHDFLRLMFESVSAFNTVGLSMGATPGLAVTSKVAVVVMMFVGRVGPLAVAAALTVQRSGPRGFRYAYEDVVVG